MKECSRCKAPMEPMTPEEDAAAQAEYRQLFGRNWLPSEVVAICEDCYQFMNQVQPYKAWARAFAAGERN